MEKEKGHARRNCRPTTETPHGPGRAGGCTAAPRQSGARLAGPSGAGRANYAEERTGDAQTWISE
eukprot:8133495-Pyramimonas_sp.AAC.1